MEKREPAKKNRLRIVHDIFGRIRIRSAFLGDPFLNARYLEAYIEALKGVKFVRLNKPAACVMIRFDGKAETRNKILSILENPPREIITTKFDLSPPPDLTGTLRVGVHMVLVLFLPFPLKAVLTWFTVAPVLTKGAGSFLERGISVETLDAGAVLFTLLRRDYLSANIITLMLSFGQYLEGITEYRSDRLLLSLYKQESDWAWIEVDGVETRILIRDVRLGDMVICGPGELIPVDGVVAEGAAAVNQASITGEPLAVDATPGSEVFAGTIIEQGKLKIRAVRVGAEATTAKISQYIEKSLMDRSVVQTESANLADRLVPLTLGLGLGIYGVTRDLRRASAALTVDYSCALKLVSPVAVKTGMKSAAEGGIIIKGAAALEAVSRVDTFIFDKTGTLTKGSPEVTDVVCFNGCTPDEVLALAAAAESHYHHPVAAAISEAAVAKGICVNEAGECDFIVAHGVSAFVDSGHVLVGNFHFLAEDEGVDCTLGLDREKILQSEGKSTLYVAREGMLMGLIALRDIIRPEAKKVLARLKETGIKRVIVLTGDQEETARAIALELGIDEIHWKLLPEDKAVILERLQDEGCKVAFVGDGVNDAPALVKADVGISMPRAADIAKESARVVLLNDDLMSLVFAREVSRKVMSVVKNNFYMTVGVNTSVLLLALFGMISPPLAAFMHNGTTIGLLGYTAGATSIAPKEE